MTIQWKKDNLDLQGRNVTNFARSLSGKGTEHVSVLFLSNISDSDTGRYQCVASNNYGTAYSQKAKISVLSTYVWMLLICMLFHVFIKYLLCGKSEKLYSNIFLLDVGPENGHSWNLQLLVVGWYKACPLFLFMYL